MIDEVWGYPISRRLFLKAAACGAHVISAGITHYAAARIGTPAAKWADRAPLHGFENAVVIVRRRVRWGLCEQLADKKAGK